MRLKFLKLKIDGNIVEVPQGTTVAAAISNCGKRKFRQSVDGESRGPLCGMGICHECRVTINGHMHQKSCQILCHQDFEVKTDE